MLRLMLLGSLAGADGVESTVRAFVTKSNPNARDSLLVTGYTQVPQKRGSSRPSRPSRPCAYGLISYGPTLMPTHAHTHKHTQWQGALRDEAGVYGWFTDAIHTYLGSQVCTFLFVVDLRIHTQAGRCSHVYVVTLQLCMWLWPTPCTPIYHLSGLPGPASGTGREGGRLHSLACKSRRCRARALCPCVFVAFVALLSSSLPLPLAITWTRTHGQSMSMVYRAPDDTVNWTVLRPTSLEGANQLQEWKTMMSSWPIDEEGSVSIPHEETMMLRAAFDLFDADKSGALDYSEVRAAMESCGMMLTDKEIHDMAGASVCCSEVWWCGVCNAGMLLTVLLACNAAHIDKDGSGTFEFAGPLLISRSRVCVCMCARWWAWRGGKDG